eukprot:4070210-Pyramimonas_sp.AAC.1
MPRLDFQSFRNKPQDLKEWPPQETTGSDYAFGVDLLNSWGAEAHPTLGRRHAMLCHATRYLQHHAMPCNAMPCYDIRLCE